MYLIFCCIIFSYFLDLSLHFRSELAFYCVLFLEFEVLFICHR